MKFYSFFNIVNKIFFVYLFLEMQLKRFVNFTDCNIFLIAFYFLLNANKVK